MSLMRLLCCEHSFETPALLTSRRRAAASERYCRRSAEQRRLLFATHSIYISPSDMAPVHFQQKWPRGRRTSPNIPPTQGGWTNEIASAAAKHALVTVFDWSSPWRLNARHTFRSFYWLLQLPKSRAGHSARLTITTATN